jgi:hypothetical protein
VKKIATLVFSMVLCLIMTACNSNRALNPDDSSEKPSASDSVTVPETPNTPADTAGETPASADKPTDMLDMYNAYADALENLTQNLVFPDGVDASEQSGDMAQNKFALYDVDNDGKEELLLFYTNTYMAGQAGYIFGYDTETKKLQTELLEFPMLTFYDNGIVKAGWSHNQGRAGDFFWPYSLYQYTPETDSYELVGMVDAWDKNYPGADDTSDPFPEDIDKSGTGFVYYIMEDGLYDTTDPVDAAEYKTWVDNYIGNASEIQITYMDLTEENISLIRNVP